jgi:hypothetical protein
MYNYLHQHNFNNIMSCAYTLNYTIILKALGSLFKRRYSEMTHKIPNPFIRQKRFPLIQC